MTSGNAGAPSGVENFDSVVLRRIVGGGEVDGAVGLLANHGVGNRRSGCGFGDDQRSDAVGGENLRCHGAESFAQKARVAADDDAGAGWFLRSHVAGDAVTARRTLAKVNSSAMTARHPEVPNLIWVAIGFT